MRTSLPIIAGLSIGLCACSAVRIPTIDLSGTSLPRLDMFSLRERDTSVATTPYALDPAEVAAIKTEFSAAFRDGRTLQFGPINARRKPSGSLVICGLVSIHKPDGTRSGMTLFDGVGSFETPDGRLAFTPRRLAGGNAEPVDVYAGCRDAGAL